MTRDHTSASPSTRANGALDGLVSQLIEEAGGSPHAEFLEEMIHSALRLIRNQTSRGDIKILNAALRELIYAFRVFAPYRGTRKVTIFGSARIAEDSPEYRQAAAFARGMSQQGWMVITGAGEGIMKAGQDGAGRDQSFGVNIRLPFEQSANEFIQNNAKLITFRYFFTRKLVFIKETDAIALFPGGFGTMDEAFETLTLLQTGKSCPAPPGVRRPRRRRLLAHLGCLHSGDAAGTWPDSARGPVPLPGRRPSRRGRERDPHVLPELPLEPVCRESARASPPPRPQPGSDRSPGGGVSRHSLGRRILAGVRASRRGRGLRLGGSAAPHVRFNRRNFGRLRQLIDALNQF